MNNDIVKSGRELAAIKKSKGVDGPCFTLNEFAQSLNISLPVIVSAIGKNKELINPPKPMNIHGGTQMNNKKVYYSHKALKQWWARYLEFKKGVVKDGTSTSI